VSVAPADLARGRYAVVAAGDSELLARTVNTLRASGYHVFQAYDAAAASELALALPTINLLIADASMPAWQGPALVRRLRECLASRPVLLHVVNAGRPKPGGHGWILEGDPVLREPFTAEQLLAAVRPLLPPPRRGPAAGSPPRSRRRREGPARIRAA
jgi:DNA-binding response OmpR family regulator